MLSSKRNLAVVDHKPWNDDPSLKFDDENTSPRAVDVTDSTCFSYSYEAADSTENQVDIPVRAISYNIHGWRDTFHADNLDRIIESLSRADADIIALQEVLHPYRPPASEAEREAYFQRVKSGKGNGFTLDCDIEDDETYLNILAKALGMSHISFGRATQDGYFGAFGYGNAILSKFPIVSEMHHVVKADEKHQVGRRIEAEDRCFSAVTLAISPAVNYSVCVTHLDQLSDDLRLEQVQEMLARLGGVAGRHLFCGDFNVFQRADCAPAQWRAILDDAASKGWPAPPETTAALDALLGAGYRDCFYLSDNHRLGRLHDKAREEADRAAAAAAGLSEDTEFPGATCWVTKPLLRIDYAFLSPPPPAAAAAAAGEGQGEGEGAGAAAGTVDGVAVRRYQRLMGEASDHFAILIDLVLTPAGAAAAADAAADSN